MQYIVSKKSIPIVLQQACDVIAFSVNGLVFTSRGLLLNNAVNGVNALW